MSQNITENNIDAKNITYTRGVLFFFSVLLIAYPVLYPVRDLLGHVGQYGLFMIWFFIAILNKPQFIVKILKSSYLYIAFFAVIILRVLNVIQEVPNGFFSPYRLVTQFSLIFIYYVFGLWHMLYSNDDTKRILIKFFIASFLVSTIISIYYLYLDPYAVRGSYSNSYFAIGDFNLIYTGVFLAIFFLVLIFRTTLKFKILYIFLFTLVVYLVIKASYMTAVLFIFILALIYLLTTINRKYFIFISLIIFVLIISIIRLELLAKFLFDISTSGWLNTAMKLRLEDISYALYNGSLTNSETILSRTELSSVSWKTFSDNILFGVNYLKYNSHTIGHHTQWIDNLARFGVFGSLLFISQLSIWYFQLLKYAVNKIDKKLFILCWVFFFLLGIVNNNMLGGLFVCMFFLSLNISKFTKKKKNKEKNL